MKKKYILKSGSYRGTFQQKQSVGVYSSNLGTAILDEKPKFPNHNDIVLDSDDLDYYQLLRDEYFRLQQQIRYTKGKLSMEEENYDLIEKELIRIKK